MTMLEQTVHHLYRVFGTQPPRRLETHSWFLGNILPGYGYDAKIYLPRLMEAGKRPVILLIDLYGNAVSLNTPDAAWRFFRYKPHGVARLSIEMFEELAIYRPVNVRDGSLGDPLVRPTEFEASVFRFFNVVQTRALDPSYDQTEIPTGSFTMELSHTGIDTFVVSAFQREGLPFGKDIINPYIKDYPYLEIRPSVTKLHSSERSCQDELEWLSKVQALFGSGWLSWRSDPETQKISFESCTF